jgi:ankyrin repeat protein
MQIAHKKARTLRGLRCWMRLTILVFVGISSYSCSQSPENQFLTAVTRNNLSAAERMLDTGNIDVNFRTRLTGETALGTACGLGHLEIARLLLARGADPNIADSDGRTPIQMAAYDGSTAIVEILIQAGAKLDIPDEEYGYTPLAVASWKGHAATVRLLIDAGADQRIPTKAGRTPLQLARDDGHDDVAQVLLSSAR